jgi:hypothetical protein
MCIFFVDYSVYSVYSVFKHAYKPETKGDEKMLKIFRMVNTYEFKVEFTHVNGEFLGSELFQVGAISREEAGDALEERVEDHVFAEYETPEEIDWDYELVDVY